MRAKTNIIAVAILLLASMPVGAVLPIHLSTENMIKQFDLALKMFQNDCGRYPSQREGLSALFALSDNQQTNLSPYLRGTLPKDPWGRDYVYRFPGEHNPKSFDLYSLGEDGISKTGGNDRDDINHWNKARPWAAHYHGRQSSDRLTNWLIAAICVSSLMFVFWQNRSRKRRTATASLSMPVPGKSTSPLPP